MSYIQDLIVNVVSGASVATRTALNKMAILGFTGQHSILRIGSGNGEFVAKFAIHESTISIIIQIAGAAYVYDLVGSVLTITVPTGGERVRDLIADFDANAPAPVKAVVSLHLPSSSTGSGAVVALAETATAVADLNRAIQDVTQLDFYYDSTDPEYEAVQNALASGQSEVILLDAFGLDETTIEAFLTANYDGNWFFLVPLTVTEAIQIAIKDYSDTQDMITIFTGTITNLQNNKGLNNAYLVHDVPTDYPNASWTAKGLLGGVAQNWKWIKDLAGQTVNSTASLSDLIAVRAANGQSYVKGQGGFNVVDGGLINTLDGSALGIRQLLGRYYIKLNTEIDLLELLVNLSNIGESLPYTDAGILTAVNKVAARLSIAGALGIIAPVETPEQAALSYDGAYQFRMIYKTVEEIKAASPADYTAGLLNTIEFEYIETQDINSINPVKGRVVLSLNQ